MIHRFSFHASLSLMVTGLVLSLSSCSSPEEEMAAQGWWTGDKVQGSPKILIDLNRQVVRYYKGGKLCGAAPISSGREGHGTVRGNYRIMEKDSDHRSSIYGSFVTDDGRIVDGDVDARSDRAPPGTHFLGASMRSFMRISGGIGMHEGYLPGFAASHGCIRLPSRMAAIFYRATPVGTPVEIVGDAPDGHLTTWLPVPHKLRPEDIVIAPKTEGDNRPKAAVAIAEPPPPPAPPKPKVVEQPKKVEVASAEKKGGFWSGMFGGGEPAEKPAQKAAAKPDKPAPVVAAAASRGETQFLDAKPAPKPAAEPKKVEVASAEPKKGGFWGGLLGGSEGPAAEKPAEKPAKPAPAPVVAAAPAPKRGETQVIDAPKPAPAPAPKKVEVASATPRKSGFWGGLFGGGEPASAPAKPAPAPAKPAAAPVVAAAKPAPAATKADEPQQISYRPLSSLDKKAGWSWGTKSASAPKPTKKTAPARGQTYFLPGYN